MLFLRNHCETLYIKLNKTDISTGDSHISGVGLSSSYFTLDIFSNLKEAKTDYFTQIMRLLLSTFWTIFICLVALIPVLIKLPGSTSLKNVLR